jgi:hypothetical protein
VKYEFLLSVIVALASGLCAFCCLNCPAAADDLRDAEPVSPTEQIPRNYKTWSLFLVCSPGWILENEKSDMLNEGKETVDLYKQFLAFGDAIGPENVAIWFWKEFAAKPRVQNIDVKRSAEYCEKYGMLPSESPQILVTTHYPDDSGLGNYFVLKLNRLDVESSTYALDKAHPVVPGSSTYRGGGRNLKWGWVSSFRVP